MCSVIVIILLGFFGQAHTQELRINQTSINNMQEHMDHLVDMLVDRVLKVSPLQHADLDKAALAKIHPDKNHGNLNIRQSALPRSPIPTSRSSFPVPVAPSLPRAPREGDKGITFKKSWMDLVLNGEKTLDIPRVMSLTTDHFMSQRNVRQSMQPIRDRRTASTSVAAAAAAAVDAAGVDAAELSRNLPHKNMHQQLVAPRHTIIDATKYIRKIMTHFEDFAKDGQVSIHEAQKAVQNIAKTPFEYGLKLHSGAVDASHAPASPTELTTEQKVDAYHSFNPLEKFAFWRFSLSVASVLGDVQPATNYSEMIAQVNGVAHSEHDLANVNAKGKLVMVQLFPEFLLPAYKMVFGPFMGFSAWMVAWVTKFATQWLMGPNELADLHREDGTVGKDLVLKIEKCRFLEESGCVKTCLHACKIPSEQFFIEEMGLPVTLKPNMTSMGCELHFGVTPVPLSEDPVATTPCFETCKHAIDRKHCY